MSYEGSSEYVAAAKSYRIANPELTGSSNLCVVKLAGEDSIRVFENIPADAFGDGVHSEKVAMTLLNKEGYTAEDIVGLYSERSPCGQYCQSNLGSFGVPESKVSWTFNYEAESRPGEYASMIENSIQMLRRG